MTEKTLNLSDLESIVLTQLKSEHYMDSTIAIYRKFYDRIGRYMQTLGISEYSEEVGESFMSTVNVGPSTFTAYKCMMRRLNDCLNGMPYRCHRTNSPYIICETYRELLGGYLQSCEQDGNSIATVDAKRKACTLFLNHIEEAGCFDISSLTTEQITKSLLIFENKDSYALIRMFLRYLADAGYMKTDMSGIVPRYSRRIPLPTVYSIEEIQRIENAVDTSTKNGVRNLAMIRLATRMGIRAGDIAKLRWNEIDFQTGQISLIQYKTGQPLTLSMPDEVAEVLYKHSLYPCPGVDDDYVFHGAKAPYERASTSIIRNVIDDCIEKARIDVSGRKHGPHAFRSSLASSMVNDDISYETVRKILGHKDPNVIKHYARTDIEHLRLCAIEPAPPTGRFADYLSGKEVIGHV